MRKILVKKLFDLIYSSCVLEHVSSPYNIVQECSRILSDNGLIAIVVPNNLYSLSWRWPIYFLRYLLKMDISTHSRRHVMAEALSKSGLSVVEFDVIGLRPPQPFLK